MSSPSLTLTRNAKSFPRNSIFVINNTTHQAWLADFWLATIGSILGNMRQAAPELDGLVLKRTGMSIQCASRRIANSHNVTQSITGLVVIFTAATTASAGANVRLSILPKYASPPPSP